MTTIDSLPLFYYPSDIREGFELDLEGDEAVHATQARRLKSGSQVVITNGRGIRAVGNIIALEGKRKITISVTECKKQLPAAVRKTLAIAIPKGERQSVLIGMATQLGISALIPLDCEFSVVHFQEKMKDRWRRLIVSACKQCRQYYFPEILPPQSVTTLVAEASNSAQIVMGDPDGEMIETLNSGKPNPPEVIAMVGPEGGFSESEMNVLSAEKILKLRLSHQILRTETAGVAILAAVNQIYPE